MARDEVKRYTAPGVPAVYQPDAPPWNMAPVPVSDRPEWMDLHVPYDPESQWQVAWHHAMLIPRGAAITFLYMTHKWWRTALVLATLALIYVMYAAR
jgi:hypothetical protein